VFNGSHLEWKDTNGASRLNIQIGPSESDSVIDDFVVLALVISAAFITVRLVSQRDEDEEQKSNENKAPRFFEFLRNLKASETDSWIGGVCGGLGQSTPVPSWVWRLCFCLMMFFYGSGLVAYLLLWIFIPKGSPRKQNLV
jgi:phage shock protein PspC (stress-responsive transcriptional regulator)